MTKDERHDSLKIRCAILTLTGLGLAAAGCSGSDHGALMESTATSGDTSAGSGGSSTSTASTTGAGGGDTGGSAGETTSSGSGAGGSSGTDDAGSGAGGAEPDDAGPLAAPTCVYHTERPASDGPVYRYSLSDDAGDGSDPTDGSIADANVSEGATATDGGNASDASGARDGTVRSEGGAADAANDAGPAPSITVQVSPFLGAYLADSTGRSLFTYGGDMAGDCKNPPISGCAADCIIAWPVFYAGARTLAPGLDDAAFGTIQRPDFTYQTTYYGWPLYYFKTDVAPGMLGGQAKSKTWHAATVIPAGIMIMKDAAATRYLGDGTGRTLYVYDQDVKGSPTSDPMSACDASCLAGHPSFWRNRLSVVSSLEPTDFSTFVPGQGREQLAYKGAPLYTSAADARSGDEKGATTGWSVALP